MAKSNFLIFLIMLIIFDGCRNHQKEGSCSDSEPFIITDGVEFYYNNGRKIVLNTLLLDKNLENTSNDSLKIKAKLIFDTGGAGLLIIRDSIADKIYPKWRQEGVKASVLSGWNAFDEYRYTKVKEPILLFLDKDSVLYKEFYVYSESSPLSDSDGLFSIPTDNEKVWELNFDYNRLILKDSSTFVGEKDVFTLELRDSLKLLKAINFPFSFISENNDTITFKEDIIIDTGTDTPLSYKHTDFVGRKDSLCRRHEIVRTVQYDYNFFLVDFCFPVAHKIWVQTIYSEMPYTISHDISMIAAGVDFLKFFNIEIDRKQAKIHFRPISRPYTTAFAEEIKDDSIAVFRAFRDINKNAVVYEADSNAYNYKGDYLRIGDVIIDVDGEKLHNKPPGYFNNLKYDSKITTIRGKDTLTIIIAKAEKLFQDSLKTNQ